LSVSDNKYVYVRGMGERYNSTEVDGVRVVSPEQNKRVVPMDLFPAALLDNIVVQKAWSADRSGEFSGGDVQVHLKDFPGKRSWSLSMSQGVTDGTTFHNHLSYSSSSADMFGFGAASRAMPGVARPIVLGAPPLPASAFTNVWSPANHLTAPNGNLALTYGDEFKVLGRPLGLLQSFTMSRSYEQRSETQYFTDDGQIAKSAYAIERSTESVQMGANASLNYRLTPGHRLSLRGLYTNKADDEVLEYEGPDPGDGSFDRRASRLAYVQRAIGYVTAEGEHELKGLLHTTVDWKFTRSDARRQSPDKREAQYIRRPIDETDPGTWALATGRREYGDLNEDGWGTTAKLAVPYRLASLGNGRVVTGYDRQSRDRGTSYRRFDFVPVQFGSSAPPESVYIGSVNDVTQSRDNYSADQLVEAYFLSADIPFGKRLRGNAGVRREFGRQNVVARNLFDPTFITSEGHTAGTDWLAGFNLTFAASEKLNFRAAASRTLNRPDLDDLSPLQSLDYVGDKIRSGNPFLTRALISNYDLRAEAFPSVGEVFAAGVFYKKLDHPIEPAVFGTNGQLGLQPQNSLGGENVGVELEARTGLGRFAGLLKPLSLNSNLSLISSHIHTQQTTDRGNSVHSLAGQAPVLLNVGLTWSSASGRDEFSVLGSSVGRRLKELYQTSDNGVANGRSNLETAGITTLDATASLTPFRGARLKIAAGNLLNHAIREMEGDLEMRTYRTGRTFSVSLSMGS
jgi:outer membrane receptor protein involved in Fe transport